TVGYAGKPESDERADATELAALLNIPLHTVELDATEIASSFDSLVYWRDDPIADIAGAGYFAVMKLAREQGVPVVMQGQGGDELFWGYSWVREAVAKSERKQRRSCGPIGSAWAIASGWLARKSRNNISRELNRLVYLDSTPDFQIACHEMSRLYTDSFRT